MSSSLALEDLRQQLFPGLSGEDGNRALLHALVCRTAVARGMQADDCPCLNDLDKLPLYNPDTLGLAYQSLAGSPFTLKEKGCFYTPPDLAANLVSHTLKPIVYAGDEPRPPESILSLTICDPAMGAGSFVLAALRFLTAALADSVRYHCRLKEKGRAVSFRWQEEEVKLPVGEFIPFLRRQAVCCLYGVDIDPIAVELARQAVWLEVGDSSFSASDLKANFKVGNSLVGCPAEELNSFSQQSGGKDALTREADAWCAARFSVSRECLNWPTPAAVKKLKQKWLFFHWPLEFPQVMSRGGFDAVVGNPPWETLQPSSAEFFSRRDPSYRSLGQLEARQRRQQMLREDPSLKAEWEEYRLGYRQLNSYFNRAFSLQGQGKGTTYKLFLELALKLTRNRGRIGLLLPTNLLSDRGAGCLRRQLLHKCNWELFLAMENRDLSFSIANGFKYGAVVLTKCGNTTSLNLATAGSGKPWDDAVRLGVNCTPQMVARFSPFNLSPPSFSSKRDLEVAEKIFSRSCFLGDSDWGVVFSQGDLNMTTASHLFPPVACWRERGYRPRPDGCWEDDRGDTALPLYEGRMIGQFDFSQKGWVKGKGRYAIWEDIPFHSKEIRPQYLIAAADCQEFPLEEGRSPLMNISSAINSRSAVAAYLRGFPCNHSLNPVRLRGGVRDHMAFLGVINSFCYDFVLRLKLEGFNLSFFLLQETPLPSYREAVNCAPLVEAVARLSLISPLFIPEWQELAKFYPHLKSVPLERLWALTPTERLRLRCIVDAIVAYLFGLEQDDLAWILRDCSHPPEKLRRKEFSRRLPLRGFWRVDKKKPPYLRHTVLALDAFKHLKELGVAAALKWELPPAAARTLGSS